MTTPVIITIIIGDDGDGGVVADVDCVGPLKKSDAPAVLRVIADQLEGVGE